MYFENGISANVAEKVCVKGIINTLYGSICLSKNITRSKCVTSSLRSFENSLAFTIKSLTFDTYFSYHEISI